MQIGEMHHGPRNLITDVPGVTVGHCTVDREDNHTGVTVVMPCPENPYTHKLTAASFVLNGFGKTAGLLQIDELGTLETPIALTNTLNVALHGTLYQDIPTEYSGFVFSHSQPEHECDHAHHVTVVENTLLSEIVQCSSLSVNSLHHQAILSLAPALRSCGVSEDGLIESVYLPDYPFCLGVQWHPERLADHDPHSQMLFNAFCRACSDMKP